MVHYGRAEAPPLPSDEGDDGDDDDDDDDEKGGEGGGENAAAAAVSSSCCSLPTLFVFGRQELDVPAVARAVVDRARALRDDPSTEGVAAVVVLPDQPLSHAAGELRLEVAALVAAEEDASSSLGEKKKRRKLPAVVVAAPAFRAVEPRAAAAKREKKGKEEETMTTQGPSRSSFDVREPSRSSTLGGLTWTLPLAVSAAAPASCAFVWVGPADDDDDDNGGGGGGEGRADDEACSSARQLLRLSLAASALGGWAEVNPRSGHLSVPSPLGNRRLLGRRYFAVQKAANAALVGIVTATSAGGKTKKEEEGAADSPSPSSAPAAAEEGEATAPLPAHIAASDALMRLARASGKKPYALSMGRPTAAKLSNFPELRAFVLVAPPGGQLPPPGTLEALAPVLTPAEAVIAWGCGSGRGKGGGEGGGGGGEEEEGDSEEEESDDDDDPASRWDPSSYSLDSLPAVALAANAAAEALERRSRRREKRGGSGESGGVARLSLVDGASYAPRPSFPSASHPPSSSQLALRQDGSLAGASNEEKELTCAADFLTNRRSWRGLETPATGGVPAREAARAVEGRSGRAAGYEGEGDK